MFAGDIRFGSVASATLIPPIAPVPVFDPAAVAATGEAAAICRMSVIATLVAAAAVAVGLIRNESPALALPLTVNVSPSATNGSAAVPVPVIATCVPSARESVQLLPS